MHSLPTTSTITTTKSFMLKHKLPTQMRRKTAKANIATTTATTNKTNVGVMTTTIYASSSRVDDDLLATVLRVHLETKLRRERARKGNATRKARVLQRATNALDEPSVVTQLTSHKSQFGFRDALVQLSYFQH